MKIPSLVRLPKNRRFSYQPRFYDPVKEEIKKKERLFQAELEGKKQISFRESLFEGHRIRSQANRKASALQLFMVFILTFVIFGYIYFGNYVIYILFAAIPVYLFFRFRKRR
jgi:hypothetical protein